MHMHRHIKECVLDFGPVYNFWLYAFERYNGLLGSQLTNNRATEPQRFLFDNLAYSFQFPTEFESEFKSLLVDYQNVIGSIGDTLNDADQP